MYFGVTTIFVCLFLFLYVVILVLRARRLPTFGRARRSEVLFRDFCLEASRASSFVVVVVVVVVRCLRVKKVSEGRFDDASGVRKVNKTLALQGVHKITRKGFLTVRSRHNRRASRSRRKKMGAFREAFIVARLFDGMDVCERIFGQLSVHGKEVENTPSRFSSARCFVRHHVRVAMEQLELKIHALRVTLVVTVCVFDCILSDIHAHTHTQKMCAQNEYKGAFSHTLCSLCTSVTLCAVALILELKMHAKNRNTHMYTCTNFQKHLHRGREDVQSC